MVPLILQIFILIQNRYEIYSQKYYSLSSQYHNIDVDVNNFIKLYFKALCFLKKRNLNMDVVDLLSHAKHYEQHRKKIQQIMNKNAKLIDPKRMMTFNTFYSARDKALKSQYKKKQQAVEKENNIILKKIVSVNQRKNQSFNPIRSSSHSNLTNLKKNMYNINEENQLLAQKLVSARSNLNQEILRTSYQKHLQCKERLKKYQVDEQYGVIPKKFKSMQRIKKLTPILTKYQFGGRSRVASSQYSNEER